MNIQQFDYTPMDLSRAFTSALVAAVERKGDKVWEDSSAAHKKSHRWWFDTLVEEFSLHIQSSDNRVTADVVAKPLLKWHKSVKIIQQ